MTSKYDRLADHLVSLGAPVITLTFAAIEAIVGPLPAQARHASAWWGATSARRYLHPYALTSACPRRVKAGSPNRGESRASANQRWVCGLFLREGEAPPT